jgi:hypothetical protein
VATLLLLIVIARLCRGLRGHGGLQLRQAGMQLLGTLLLSMTVACCSRRPLLLLQLGCQHVRVLLLVLLQQLLRQAPVKHHLLLLPLLLLLLLLLPTQSRAECWMLQQLTQR